MLQMDDRCQEESYLGVPPHDRCQAKEDYDYRMGSFNPITGQWTQHPHSPLRARSVPWGVNLIALHVHVMAPDAKGIGSFPILNP